MTNKNQNNTNFEANLLSRLSCLGSIPMLGILLCAFCDFSLSAPEIDLLKGFEILNMIIFAGNMVIV